MSTPSLQPAELDYVWVAKRPQGWRGCESTVRGKAEESSPSFGPAQFPNGSNYV